MTCLVESKIDETLYIGSEYKLHKTTTVYYDNYFYYMLILKEKNVSFLFQVRQ